jgi:nitronate monooxygenase
MTSVQLTTAWTTTMGIRLPIVNAPMGGVAGGALAAAVSRAGGLGMVGMGSAASVGHLRQELEHVLGMDHPFGIGLVGWVVAREPELLQVALAAKPTLLSISFGDDSSWVHRAHDEGIITATQISTVQAAEHAVETGVDVLVARGAEGGGHGEPAVGTLPLLAAVLDQVCAPVLAAGGISSSRGLAAVLAAGASAAWLGTFFAACPEAMTSPGARRALLAASEVDTVTTRAFDVAHDYPWPTRIPERALRNDFTRRWLDREDELATDHQAHRSLRMRPPWTIPRSPQ